MTRRLWPLLAALLLIAIPSGIEAQDEEHATLEEARREFESARAAYDAGDFDRALAAFRRSYELTGSADILYNIGTVAERLRRDREALEAYEQYLERVPDAPDRANIEGRIRLLRASLTESDASASVDAAHATESADVADVEPVAQDIEHDAAAAPPAGAGVAAAPIALLVAGGAAAIVGVVLLGVALTDIGSIESAPRPSRWEDYADRYDQVPLLSGSGIALLVTGIAAGTAGALWLALSPSEQSADVAIGPGSVRVRGWF